MAVLQIDALTVRFGGVVALDEVSLQVDEGEIVGVIGPNGAGKTTLFNACCGFVRADSGRISYRGRSLERIRPHQLAGLGVARTLQGLGLWQGLTACEQVMAALPAAPGQTRDGLLGALLGLPASDRAEHARRERARAALAELDAAEVADRHPESIPYGMRKRVALARALVAEPALLLLDEPASGLSPAELDHLETQLRRLRERTAVVLVEHHMDLVMSVCDRVVVLDLGRVIAAGPPDAIRSDPAVTVAYLGREVSGGRAAHDA